MLLVILIIALGLIILGGLYLYNRKEKYDVHKREEVFLASGNTNKVFNVLTPDKIDKACEIYGARVASIEDIQRAWQDGAQWFALGYYKKNGNTQTMAVHPMQQALGGAGAFRGLVFMDQPNASNIHCIGIKPKYHTPGVLPWFHGDQIPDMWSRYD